MSTGLNQTPIDGDLIELLDHTAAGGASGGGEGGDVDARERFRSSFRDACLIEAELHDGDVHPSRVNKRLRDALGDDFNPRQLSGIWSWACGPHGFLDNTDEPAPIDAAVSKGNGNKTVTLRRWRDAA